MVIYDIENKKVLNNITLYLTPDEAGNLADSAKDLSKNPDHHHHHINDKDHKYEITLAVYTEGNIEQFDEESKRLINMRDNSEGMIEIIDAFEEGDGHFSIIEVPGESKKEKFRFSVTPDSYRAIKNILQSRPFDSMPGIRYRYYWDGSMGGKTESKIQIGIRCEALESGKRFEFSVPHVLASNLKWFNELELLEFVDQGVGTEVFIGNSKSVRNADGTWTCSQYVLDRPWWKFW